MSSFRLFQLDLVGAFSRVAKPPSPYPTGPYWQFYLILLQRLQGALPEGLEKWRTHAGFNGVKIDGRKAHGGKLTGPPLKSVILDAYYRFPSPEISGFGEWEVPVLKAIVHGLTEAWSEFEASFSVPHLDWYPSFASAQPPVGLPIANKACSLKSLTYNSLSLSPQRLSEAMRRNFTPPAPKPASSSAARPSYLPLDPQSRAQLGETKKYEQAANPRLTQLGIAAQPSAPSPPSGFPPSQPFGAPPPPMPSVPVNPYQYATAMFRTIAEAVHIRVGNWLASQQVTQAIGTGPVPTATSGVRGGNVMPGNHLRH